MFDPRTFDMDEADDLTRKEGASWFLNRADSNEDLEAQVAHQIVDRMGWIARREFIAALPRHQRGWFER